MTDQGQDSPSFDIPAIDVHAHYGEYIRDATDPLKRRFSSGDAETVVARAKAANTSCTVVSPLRGLMPRGRADVIAGNEEAARVVDRIDGLRQWVVLDPTQEQTYSQVRTMLERPKCVGIKIHPEEHEYPIAKYGRAIFECAAESGALILTHSGEHRSMPAEFVPLANDFPQVNVILAHLGHGSGAGGAPDLQVRAIQACKHGNLFTDTSSAQSILPGLIEWAVGEVGAEHVLYGTDTPLYFAASQRARIDHADLNERDKRMVLRENAQRLLGMS